MDIFATRGPILLLSPELLIFHSMQNRTSGVSSVFLLLGQPESLVMVSWPSLLTQREEPGTLSS